MPIRLLGPEVASKIAAGEVVERPSSVVKELIENSLDAGASQIKVEVRGGGRRLIRVLDDGCGIPANEVEIAFQRHSTSKLERAEDLFHISTLGFRGEALPSIATVSRVIMVTRTADQDAGILVRLEGGRIVRKEPKGSPLGTSVSVEDLFYNTPARLKFLRSDSTETGHIVDLVTRYAMAYPGVRFSLTCDGRSVFRSTGSGNLYEALQEVYGLEVARQMLEIAGEEGIAVHGYVGTPSLHRSSGRDLTLLINGRWVKDQLLGYAVREAYHTLLPTRRHPVVVLRIDVPPEDIDVNVHPAKAEVRFRKSGEVFTAVQRAVRHALTERAPIPVMAPRIAQGEERPRLLETSKASASQMAMGVQRTEPEVRARIPPLRVLGQLGRTYIIAEGPEGMYLIDQHTAHERILYERLLSERARLTISSQRLLEPMTLEVTPQEASFLEEHLETIRSYGFEIEPFGGQTYLLRAIPAMLEDANPIEAIREIVDGVLRSPGRWEEEFIISLACHGAVKAGQALAQGEMEELARQLEKTTSPRTCAHGRPTMVHLSTEQLEREFRRE